MTKRVLTIEIGNRFTRICEMNGYTDKPVVHSCVSFQTPAGTIEDGFIRNKEILAGMINQKLIEMRVRTEDVIFVLNSTKIANREVLIPRIKKEEKVRAIINLQASDYFPIDVSDYTISYYYMNKNAKKAETDDKNKILLLAAPNSLLQSYVALAQACGLHMEAIDYIGNSYYQIVRKQVESGIDISLHMNENTSIINIMENETLLLQRIIPYGAEEVIQRVVENPSFAAENGEEAIKLLCKEKLINYQFELPGNAAGNEEWESSESFEKARSEIRAKEDVTNAFRFIVNNVIRVLDYFTSKNADKKITYIYVSGLAAKFQGVIHLLRNELGYDVRKIEELYSVKFSDKTRIEAETQMDYISVIGAGMHPVKFQLKQSKPKGVQTTDVKYFQYGFVFAAALSLAFTGIQFGLKTAASRHQNYLQDREKQLSYIEGIYSKHDQAKAKYDNIKSVYEMTENDNKNLHKLLDELEQKLPSSMTVVMLSVTTDGITMDIETNSKISVAKMIMTLSEIKSISNITVPEISETEEGENSGILTDEFEVSCTYSQNTAEE